MVRFNIIGHGFLDVADPSGVSFKAQNQHFRFAEISLGRSTEFSVPATDHNRAMLGFGEDPAETGEMLRKVWPAQMAYDCDVVNGTIAVTGFAAEAFTCVFTIGNAEWIDALQNKKLSECVSSWDKGVSWSGAGTPMDANDPSLVGVNEAIIKYDNGTLFSPNWQLVPSVRVKAYIEDILTNLGITNNIDIDDDLWMVSGSMKGGGRDTVTISSTMANAVTVSPQVENYLALADIEIEWATILLFDGGAIGGGHFPAKAIEAQRDIQITFPTTMPDCYCVKWSHKLSRYSQVGTGSNLSGQTVTLHKRDKVFFADTPVSWNGYQDTFHPYSFTVDIVSDGDLALGETWFIRNNHPDMTVFEFLKSVALATGTELTVDGENGVTMGAGLYGNGSDFKALDRVVAVERVTRRVESWGDDTKTAAIAFDSDDYVTDRIRSAYEVDNEQQQGNADHVSKFSEGNVGDNGVVIADVDVASSPAKFKAKRWTLAMATADSVWLQRIDTPDPVGYIDIADNSTCLQVRCAMELAELFALQSSTVLLWRGCAYLWTDASWSDGVLSLTLQRVSAQYVVPSPILPYDAKVEYLESDGSQWIDTGIVLDENDVVEIEAMILNKSGDNFMMGANGLTGEGNTYIDAYGNSTYYVRFGSTSSASQSGNASADMNVWRTYKIEKGHFYVDGVQKLTPIFASMPSRSLAIFGRNSSTPIGGVVRIRAARIIRGGLPIVELSSVRLGSVGYMYDAVTNSLLPNHGVFIYGNDV